MPAPRIVDADRADEDMRSAFDVRNRLIHE
jgi:hypothetical protein